MSDFFGISMTYIMIGLLAILALAAGSIAYVLLRNRVMFLIGVRNIPRRRAQTILIIIGLMLSTVIISAAFSVGDTADYSITSTVYNRLQSVDEIVQVAADESGDDDPFEGGSLITALPIHEDRAAGYVSTIKEIPNVDGAVSVMRGVVSVLNQTKSQSEARVIMVGVEPSQTQGFETDFESVGGERVELAALGADEIYANESAAEQLDITPGDQLVISTNNQSHAFTVRDVLKDRVLTGSIGLQEGFVLSLARTQELFGRAAQVDLIAVSNTGGVHDSVKHSEQVTDDIQQALAGTRLQANETKADAVDQAAEVASVFTTIFLVLGLFSIAAGIMLIFLIFVMLAAERKVEMGMMRAVGTKRTHLVQSFMSEGMVYNIGAAAVGCAIGVAVGVVMVMVMQRLFADENLDITFHVSARSLVISYSIGVVLTFLTVTFSAWRTGSLNIVSAIRDLPEPPLLKPRPSFRSPLSFILWFFFKSESVGGFLIGLAKVLGASLGVAAGVALFMGAFSVYDAGGAAGGVIAVIMAIFAGLLIAVCAVLILVMLNGMFQTGPLLIVAGLPLIILGYASGMAFPFGAGLTMVIAGAALCVQSLGVPARPVFTTMGLTILFFWLLFAGNNVPGLKELDGDIEMFFLSGITMVLAGTFVLIYNADLLLGLLTLSGGFLTTLVPSIRTAVAYPLANKFRTGMTIAMISLVMFALVMMSTMNENFDRVFLSDKADGGYDIYASENPGNAIPSIADAMSEEGADASAIAVEDTLKEANLSTASACEVEEGELPAQQAALTSKSRASQTVASTRRIRSTAQATASWSTTS